jgi:hypothetical protein
MLFLGTFINLPIQITYMGVNKRQLFIRAAAASVAASLIIGCHDCRGESAQRYGSYAQIEKSHGASADLLGSKNLADLESRLPAFSSKLRELAKRRGASGLAGLYEKTAPHLLKLVSDERFERNLSYVDDLDFFLQFFENARTKDEKLAVIFLALPRLEEGTVVFGDGPEPGSILFERLQAERAFMQMVADDPEIEYLELVLMGTFSKPGGSAPDGRERMLFFEEFSKLY